MNCSEFYENYACQGFLQVDSEKLVGKASFFLKSPVLDVGCYFGEKTFLLSELFEVVGCDLSSIAVRKARERFPNLKFFVCDFEGKAVGWREKFNSVFVVEVVEHVFDTERFLENCCSVLKVGGVLFLSTPNFLSLLNRVRIFFGDVRGVFGLVDGGHIRFFTFESIERKVVEAGFRIVKVSGYNAHRLFKGVWLPNVFCDSIVVVAVKV